MKFGAEQVHGYLTRHHDFLVAFRANHLVERQLEMPSCFFNSAATKPDIQKLA